MVSDIVEIAENGLHLSLHRGFLCVRDESSERGRVVLDDIAALILSAQQVTISKNIMTALAERDVPIVVCGKNWHPISICHSLSGHHQGAGVLYDQIEASAALRKRLWQRLIQEKIRNQAITLGHHTDLTDKIKTLLNMAKQVRSGDPDNKEAQAAKLYWRSLMGNDFRRDYTQDGQNAMLNYGYTVLRAATARALTATGLHPAIGIHHRNRNNLFCLVDDVMEPYRPLIDDTVCTLWKEHGKDFGGITPEIKRILSGILTKDLIGERGASPLVNCLTRTAQSIKESFQEKDMRIVLPEIPALGTLL